ncbi:MAG: rhodanese-like domain-containing protein [Acidobacteria bacterium]|nr:rhodanese-like domain-containing protein [Acidobacteriota bacterium]
MARKLSVLILMLAGIVLSVEEAASQTPTSQPAVEKQSSAQSQPAKAPERIAVGELKKKLDSGEKLLLIDVREDYELKADGAIAGAIHIPVAELDARMKDIPKDVQLVFY